MTDRPLTLRQRRAVQALAGGTSYEAAAREAGVSARALYSWRREEWFQAALRETQDALLAEAPGGLRAATAAVVTTLRAVMDDADAPVTACAGRTRSLGPRLPRSDGGGAGRPNRTHGGESGRERRAVPALGHVRFRCRLDRLEAAIGRYPTAPAPEAPASPEEEAARFAEIVAFYCSLRQVSAVVRPSGSSGPTWTSTPVCSACAVRSRRRAPPRRRAGRPGASR